MNTRRSLLVAFGALPLSALRVGGAQTKNKQHADEIDRGKELMIQAANELSNSEFGRARLLLHVLVHSYPDSPYVAQANVLTFYAIASEFPSLKGGGRLLAQIDKFLADVEGDETLGTQGNWTPVRIKRELDVICPIKYFRLNPAPVRLGRVSFGIDQDTGCFIFQTVNLTNTTEQVARRVWLFWSLYDELDLNVPVSTASDILIDSHDVDNVVSPTQDLGWHLPPDFDYKKTPLGGQKAFRLVLGVSRIEWSDGSTWVVADNPSDPKGAT